MIIYIALPRQNQIVPRWLFLPSASDIDALRHRKTTTHLFHEVMDIVNRQTGVGVFVFVSTSNLLDPNKDECLVRYIYKDTKLNGKQFYITDSTK